MLISIIIEVGFKRKGKAFAFPFDLIILQFRVKSKYNKI